MKTTTLALILFLTGLDLWAQMPPASNTPPALRRLLPRARTATNNPAARPSALPAVPGLVAPPSAASVVPLSPVAPQSAASTTPAPQPVAPSSPSGSAPPEKEVPGYTYNWPSVDVNQVLDVYAGLVGRTILHASLPAASIVLQTQSPLTKTEAIEALQAVLALNGISLINIGDKFVKAVPSDQAGSMGGSLDSTDASKLPDLGSYVTHIVQLNYVKPSAIVPAIQPLAKLKDIIPIDDNGILVIRDYAENVKRMLEMIQQIDVSVPAEIISEVIPIKYALADDIASALNSLGGTGSGTPVSIGSSTAKAPASGFTRPGGTTGAPGTPGASGLNGQTGQTSGTTRYGAQATTSGAPATGNTFQQRIRTLLQNATGGGQQQPIEILGQTKIIADERSNSLLVFASRQDMDMITNIVSKLDVLLSQVLIEAVIIDYGLGPNTFSFGVSAAQNPQNYSPSVPVVGGGGFNNGPSLLSSLSSLTSVSTNGASGFASSLGGGLSYFGNIGPNWDVALQAAESDSHASIIQRPRIQTSQAKPAQFFVGETVPYVTSTYNYGGVEGNQSSYSQLSVGVELDVTPFINPDGLVVMDINQEIDDLDGTTQIEGVGAVPNTDKRTLSSEIAVLNGDTVMLGGFIKNQKSTSKSGVPFLDRIPLLGNLFSSRNDSKQREELIVLMRPTVLKTPEIAAANTIKEEQRLPGVSAAEAEDEADERKEVQAEQKAEHKRAKSQGISDGFYNPVLETNTNNAAPSNSNSVLLPVPNH
ncbi:MAG TPA: secretin N-terminal domain-containing protein [Verrucomicrobiae bacterium]|jgi:general secretion pathway protein D